MADEKTFPMTDVESGQKPGAAVRSAPLPAHGLPERNPFLSSAIYGVTHVNPAQQNSIPYDIPLGVRTVDLGALTPVWGGPVNNATYASANQGRDRNRIDTDADGLWRKRRQTCPDHRWIEPDEACGVLARRDPCRCPGGRGRPVASDCRSEAGQRRDRRRSPLAAVGTDDHCHGHRRLRREQPDRRRPPRPHH